MSDNKIRNKIASFLLLTFGITAINILHCEAGFADLLNGGDRLDEVEYTKEKVKDGIYDITQAQITKQYTLLKYLKESRESELAYGSLESGECSEVTGQDSDEYGNTWDIYCEDTDFILTDKDLKASVKNKLSEHQISLIACANGFNQRQPLFEFERNETSSGSVKFSIDNYSFMVYRGLDELTLSEYEYNSESDALLELLDNRRGYIPSVGSKRQDNGEYKQPLNIELEKETLGDNDYITKSERDCGHGGEYEDLADVRSDSIDSKEISVGVYGSSKSSVSGMSVGEKNNLQFKVGSRVLKGVHGCGVQQSKAVLFYPWVKMFYHQYKSGGRETDYDIKYTTVLSNYVRGILPTSYAEAGYYKSSDINVNLKSNMWNTNQRSNRHHGTDSINSGSSVELDTNGYETRVYIGTYQFIIADGKNKEAIESASGAIYGDYSESKAIAKHRAYIDSTLKTLDGYRMVLWVNKDDMTNDVQSGGVKVAKPGTDIRVLNNGSQSSNSDLKYYLQPDTGTTSASDGDIDVREGSTITEYYKVFSDTSGNVMLVSSSSLDSLIEVRTGRVILSKGEKIDDLSDADAVRINERTKIISNYVNAIARNKGKDTSSEVNWVSDGKWYNEAFELYMVYQVTDIEAGLIMPGIRTTVIDTKLSPLNTGKDSNHTKWNAAQYKLNNKSDAGGNGYVIGAFDGKEIRMMDIESLFKTKIFYISNVTSQESN